MVYSKDNDIVDQLNSISYSVRVSPKEKRDWDDYAKKYFSGKKARMVRTLVNKSIEFGDPSSLQPFENNTSFQLFQELIENQNQQKNESISKLVQKVESVLVDNELIKTLLSQLLQGKTQRISKPDEVVKIPLETTVYSLIYDFMNERSEISNAEEIINFLNNNPDGKLWLNSIKDNPEGIKISVAWVIEEIAKDLFEKTGNLAFKENGGNKFDF